MWIPSHVQRTPSPAQSVKAIGNSVPSYPYRRGSPLLIGVRSKYKLSTEQIPVLYRTRKFLEKDLSSTTLLRRQQLPSEAGCVPSLCWDQVQTVFMQLRLVSMFSKAFYHVYFQICTQATGAACGSVTIKATTS